MVSRRAMGLAAILGFAFVGAAQAQGNGPGFHAAIFFDGGCSAAFNQIVSVPTPPATAGPTTAPCGSGTGAAGGEAAATSLRASSHSAHECCGTFSGSTGRARIQIENIVITGPAAANIPVSMNFRMRGALASSPDFGQAGVQLYIALGGGLQSTSAVDMSSSGFVNQTGVFAPLPLGFSSAVVDQHFVTPVGVAVPNQPLRLDLELMAYSGMAGVGLTHSDFFTGSSGVTLPFGIPVFNLPPGYTVSIPELNIVNNFVALPATISDDIFIVGTNVSEISLGTVTQVTGSVRIVDNDAATIIDLSQLQSAGVSVIVNDNDAATVIDLSQLQSASGNVVVNDNDSLTSIDLGALQSAGNVVVVDNDAATIIDLSQLQSASGNVVVNDNDSLTSVDLGALDSAGGNVSIDNNTSATGIDLGELDTVGGAVAIDNNASATGIDLSQLDTVGGSVNVNNNTSATGIDLGELDTVGGAVAIDNNTSATGIDISSLQYVDGDLDVSSNGPCTTITVGALATVTGNLILESCGLGAFTVGPAAAGGNAVIAASGYDNVSGASAAGTTTISSATIDARITVHVPHGSFVTPTSFSLTRLDPSTLLPVPGLAAGGAAATIDPIAAYHITFGVPILNRDATLTFDIFLAGLDVATADALVDAVANGTVTLVTRSDAPDSQYQAFPVCTEGTDPTPDGCIVVQLLDAEEQPTTGAPAIVRFVGVTGHFSTWGVALVGEGSTPSFAFSGLLSPYPAPPHDATPTFQQGRVVPLKFAWVDSTGVAVDSAAAGPTVRIYPVSCASLAPASDPITAEDAGDSGGVRYDAATMMWIVNWSTRGVAAGCYAIEVSVGNETFAAPASTFPVSLRGR